MAKLPKGHHLHQRVALDPKKQLQFAELRHFGASYLLNDMEFPDWVVALQMRH